MVRPKNAKIVPNNMGSRPSSCIWQQTNIPTVTQITEETPNDFELELSDELCAVLPYKVASDLFKTDPSANYQAFERRASAMLQILDTATRGISVNITEGEI